MEINSLMTNPEHHLPILEKSVDDLVSFSSAVFLSLPKIDKSDSMAFMALCFTSSQHDRLKTVKLLVDAKLQMDAGQIARSMLEGMAYLLWANEKPSERAILWREYAYVQDFKTMQKREKWKEVYDPDMKKNIEDKVKLTGDTYYSSYTRKDLREGKPLPPDPYGNAWYVSEINNIGDVFNIIGARQMYDIAYAETSEWLHWNITALEHALHYEGDTINYSSADPHMACIALSTGFQALCKSLKILDAHLKLGHEEKLQELENNFSQTLK